jgi:energy-coupling factor transporter transmembrane protein EcfT
MVLLIVTTPYPDVFNLIRPIMPRIIAEGLIVTYRSIFVLLELTDELIKALRVRGGISRRKYISNIKNFSSGIGLLLVKGFDFSEKFYGMMNVRGYGRKITGSQRQSVTTYNDILAILIGLLIFVITIGTVIKKELLQLGIYILLLSVITLVISFIFKQFTT